MMKLKCNWVIALAFAAPSLFAQYSKERVIPIDTLFALVEKNSTQLRISGTIRDNAQQAIEIAKSNLLPSIDIGLSALYLGDATITDRDFTNVQRAPMPHFGNTFSLEASYLLFAGGAVSNGIAKSQLESQVAELNHQKNRSGLRLLVTGYYLDLYKLQNQRKVFLKNIEETDVLIRQIKAREKEGMALNNDITRYELMQQNLRVALIEIENNIGIINKQLVTTLGLPDETLIRVDTTIQQMKLTPSSREELMQIASLNRPELKSAVLNNQIADRQVSLARSAYYPSLALIAANEFTGPITIEVPPINKNLNYWCLGLGVKYNLASLYKSGKEVHMAKINQSRSQLAQQAELEKTKTSVYAAQSKYLESFDKLTTYEKSYQLASENYHVINKRYLNGLVLITEMLDASNIRLNAELEVVNARLNIIYNYYKLMFEVGKI